MVPLFRRQSMTVQYGYYENSNSKHPVIKMRGKYLRRFGFEVGDTVEISIEQGQITIRKTEPQLTTEAR